MQYAEGEMRYPINIRSYARLNIGMADKIIQPELWEFGDVANGHLNLINPVVRHNIMKSVAFLDISETI